MFINGVLLTEFILATFALPQMRYSSVRIEVESLEVLNNSFLWLCYYILT